ncbi:MAG: serine hydrolase domain-containing protein [Planctomycetota bacterium]
MIATGLRDQLEASVRAGNAKGVQAYLSLRGEVAFACTIGEALPGVAMRADTAVLWMSAGKPLTAVAIATLLGAGRLDWDDPVSDWVPGFEAHGKEAVTVRQVLMHTGGFRAAAVDYPADDWPTIQRKVNAARLEPGWVPGERAGYHVHTGWWALGAVIEACSGEEFAAYMRRAVLEPTGMTRSWVTMPAEVHAGLTQRSLLAAMPNTLGSGSESVTAWDFTGTETQAWCGNVRPGGNAYGPASELQRFYRMMLDETAVGGDAPGTIDGVRIIDPTIARELVHRHRDGMMDRTFRHVMDWGLGFMLDSKHHQAEGNTSPYGYGPYASPNTFGHGGSQCAVGFADPQHQLAGAILWNGQPGEPAHQKRLDVAMAALYEDLGLV